MSILDRYNIEFFIVKNSQNGGYPLIRSRDNSLAGYHIIGYLFGQSIEFLVKDVIPEIDKALSDRPFDSDGGGITSFLTIGVIISVLSGDNALKPDVSLPTADVRDLITVWVEWLQSNDFNRISPMPIQASTLGYY